MTENTKDESEGTGGPSVLSAGLCTNYDEDMCDADDPRRGAWSPQRFSECSNCFNGFSDMDHVCPKCEGTGVVHNVK